MLDLTEAHVVPLLDSYNPHHLAGTTDSPINVPKTNRARTNLWLVVGREGGSKPLGSLAAHGCRGVPTLAQ